MIIAAFTGVGKTYFCKKEPHALDFVCMPWKYTNFYEVSATFEEEKRYKARGKNNIIFRSLLSINIIV